MLVIVVLNVLQKTPSSLIETVAPDSSRKPRYWQHDWVMLWSQESTAVSVTESSLLRLAFEVRRARSRKTLAMLREVLLITSFTCGGALVEKKRKNRASSRTVPASRYEDSKTEARSRTPAYSRSRFGRQAALRESDADGSRQDVSKPVSLSTVRTRHPRPRQTGLTLWCFGLPRQIALPRATSGSRNVV